MNLFPYRQPSRERLRLFVSLFGVLVLPAVSVAQIALGAGDYVCTIGSKSIGSA